MHVIKWLRLLFAHPSQNLPGNHTNPHYFIQHKAKTNEEKNENKKKNEI